MPAGGLLHAVQHLALQSLYPTHAAYVSAFTTAAKSDKAAGFLTPGDYQAAVAAAQEAPIP